MIRARVYSGTSLYEGQDEPLLAVALLEVAAPTPVGPTAGAVAELDVALKSLRA
jgi:hypothetical protein